MTEILARNNAKIEALIIDKTQRLLVTKAVSGDFRLALERSFAQDFQRITQRAILRLINELDGRGYLKLFDKQAKLLRLKFRRKRDFLRESNKLLRDHLSDFHDFLFSIPERYEFRKVHSTYSLMAYEYGAITALRSLGFSARSRRLEAFEPYVVSKAVDAGDMVEFGLSDAEIQAFFEIGHSRFATDMTQGWMDFLRQDIRDMLFVEQLGIDQIAARIATNLSHYSGTAIPDWRGLRIARTETQIAFNSAMNDQFVRSGVKKREWITVGDNRVRPSHAMNEGAGMIAYPNPFPNGAMHPGDGADSVNCRCSIIGDLSDPNTLIEPWDGTPQMMEPGTPMLPKSPPRAKRIPHKPAAPEPPPRKFSKGDVVPDELVGKPPVNLADDVVENYPPADGTYANQFGDSSLNRYKNADGTLTAERQALHDRIIEDHLKTATAVDEPTAYMTGGGPASGKSMVLEDRLFVEEFGSNIVKIDADEIKRLLPDYKDLVAKGDASAASFVQEESYKLSREILERASASGRNVMLDGTGDSGLASLEKRIRQMRTGGQRVVADYVTVDTDIALARNLQRAKETGRMVPEEYVKSVHQNISRILPDAVEKGLFDEITLWDSNTLGKRIRIMSYQDGKMIIHDDMLWKRFLSKKTADPTKPNPFATPQIGGKMPSTAAGINEEVQSIASILEGPWGKDPAFLKSAKKRIANLKAKKNRITGIAEPKPKPTPPKTTAKPPKAPKTFPKAIDELEHVSDLGGSTGAKLYRDPVTGKKYVLKRGGGPSPAAHLENEYLAEEAYRAAGARVPKSYLYETPSGPVKLSEFIDDAMDLKTLKATDPARYKKVVAKIEKDFAADAALGNWDVVGLNMDNILVDAKNIPWRVDVGGSLKYRAQGAIKTADQFTHFPTELWTLTKEGNSAAQVFETMTFKTKLKSMEKLVERRTQILSTIKDKKLRDIVSARIDQVEDVLIHSRKFSEAGWKMDSYTDKVMKHRMGMKNQGVYDAIPDEILIKKGVTENYSHNRVHGDFRKGKGLPEGETLPGKFKQYVDDAGGDYSEIVNYTNEQASNSWRETPVSYKRFLVEHRTDRAGEFYWRRGSKKGYINYSEAYEEAMAANHAFTYDIMSKTKFYNNDRAAGVVRTVRTEAHDLIKKRFPSQPGVDIMGEGVAFGEQQMARGAAESVSVFKDFYHKGYYVTVQEVEHANVVGQYFSGKIYHNSVSDMFAGIHENELVCVLPKRVKFNLKPHRQLPDDWAKAQGDDVWKARPKWDKAQTARAEAELAGRSSTEPAVSKITKPKTQSAAKPSSLSEQADALQMKAAKTNKLVENYDDALTKAMHQEAFDTHFAKYNKSWADMPEQEKMEWMEWVQGLSQTEKQTYNIGWLHEVWVL